MQNAHLLLTSCALWFVIFCSKVLSAKCIFIFLCCFLVFSPPRFKCNSLAIYPMRWERECFLWGESVSMVWSTSVFCEVWACEVKGFSMRSEFEVEGVRLKFEGLKFEISMSSPRSKVWGWTSKVWSLKSLCQVQGLRCEGELRRFEVWNFYVKSKV